MKWNCSIRSCVWSASWLLPFLLFMVSAPSWIGAGESLDLRLLRVVLCDAMETGSCGPGNRRCPKPEWAIDQDSWTSAGKCQIHWSTALHYGYGRDKNPALVFDPEINERIADQFLRDLMKRRLEATPLWLAYKYNCGPSYPFEGPRTEHKTAKGQRCWAYARRAATEYAKRIQR